MHFSYIPSPPAANILQELAPYAGEWDKKHEFPKEAVTKLVGPCFSRSGAWCLRTAE